MPQSETTGAFHLGKKTGNFGGSKSGFPIGKKLFHLVVNPGTWRSLTVDLELVQTTRNVNGTRDSVRKFQPGKRDHLFRFSTFSGNFPVGRTDQTCSIYRRTRNSGNFDKLGPYIFSKSSNNLLKSSSMLIGFEKKANVIKILHR